MVRERSAVVRLNYLMRLALHKYTIGWPFEAKTSNRIIRQPPHPQATYSENRTQQGLKQDGLPAQACAPLLKKTTMPVRRQRESVPFVVFRTGKSAGNANYAF